MGLWRYGDRFFLEVEEAYKVRDDLNKEYQGNVWKVYEVSVEILRNLEEF